MREVGESRPEVEDVVTTEAAHNHYHPVKVFLTEALQQYDGGHHINRLSQYFTDETRPKPIFPLLLRRWLIGAVARVITTQGAMLVLVGNQGIGKDYFAKWLCSPLPHLFLESGIDPDSKDNRLDAARRWIWCVSELAPPPGGATWKG